MEGGKEGGFFFSNIFWVDLSENSWKQDGKKIQHLLGVFLLEQYTVSVLISSTMFFQSEIRGGLEDYSSQKLSN